MTADRSGRRRKLELERAEEDSAIDTDAFSNSVSLKLQDLIPDRTGSVVIQTDGAPLVMILEDFGQIRARGIAPEGTQSQHTDVSGFDYVAFGTGVILYFAADEVRLVLRRGGQDLAPRRELPRSVSYLVERELAEPRHGHGRSH
jgi:hypothetical protein